MANSYLHEISSRLDRVFESSKGINDDEIKSHYARYLCVITSGYLEESIKIIIKNYVLTKSSPIISNYINCTTKKINNFNTEKIEKFLNNFNSEWTESFITQLTDEEKDSINSVNANRNQIAHGQNVNVSYTRVLEWYKNTKHVVQKLVNIVNS